MLFHLHDGKVEDNVPASRGKRAVSISRAGNNFSDEVAACIFWIEVCT
jgi:hypothetical protein